MTARSLLLAALAVAFAAPAAAFADAGDLDPAFGDDGAATLIESRYPYAAPAATVAQPGGGALLFGTRGTEDGLEVVMARITARGRLDPAFDGDGVKVLPASVGTSAVDAVALPGGDVALLANGADGAHGALKLSRLSPTGVLRAGFATAGTATERYQDYRDDAIFYTGPYAQYGVAGTRLAVSGDRIYVGVAVSADSDYYEPWGQHDTGAVTAFGLDGRLDLAFGDAGRAGLPEGYAAWGPVDLSPTALGGRLVVLAGAPGGPWLNARSAVLRLDADGVLDDSFGDHGIAPLAFGPPDEGQGDTAYAVQALPDDGVAVAGSRFPDEPSLWRLTDTGDADGAPVALGVETVADLDLVDGTLYGTGTKRMSDESVVGAFLRFDADGLDGAFGDGGVAAVGPASQIVPSAMTATTDDFLLAVGHYRSSGDTSRWTALRVDLRGARRAVLASAPVTVDENSGGDETYGPGWAIVRTPAAWYYGKTVTMRWQRCDTAHPAESPAGAADCVDIAGEAGDRYVATDADRDRHIRVVETNSSPAGDVTAASATAHVGDPPIDLRFDDAPTVVPAGPVAPGDVVRAAWTASGGHDGGRAEVTWFTCGREDGDCRPVDADDDTDDAYTTTGADAGRWMRAIVALYGGQEGEFASAQTTNATQVSSGGGGGPAPVSTAPPAISPAPAAVEGTTLQRTSDGAWDQAGLTFAYRWERCTSGGATPGGCAAIPGAAGTTFATGGSDAGRFVRLVVEARKDAGPMGRAVSAVTEITAKPAPVAPVPAPPPPASSGGTATPSASPAPASPSPATAPSSEASPAQVFTTSVDTTTTARMPEVRGLRPEQARARILAAGIHAEVDVVATTRPKPLTLNGRRLAIGEVSAQSVAAGTPVTSSVAALRKVRLVTEAGPKATKANGGPMGPSCASAKARGQMERASLADLFELLQAKRCTKVDLDFTVSKAAKTLNVRSVARSERELEIRVVVPGDPDRMDLGVVLRQGAFTSAAPFDRDDWALTAGASNVFGVQVVNAAGKTVDGAEVLVDGSNVGADDRRVRADGGIAVVGGFTPDKAGVVRVLVQQTDRSGNRLFGFTRFRVVRRDGPFVGIDGRRYGADGRLAAGGRAVARAAGFGDLLGALRSLAESLGGAVRSLFEANVSETTITSAARTNLGSIVMIATGGNVVSAGGANVVSAGGGNVIAAGGANVVSAGGANVVAAGGANVVSAGGANVVAAGGLNLLSLASGNVVSAGGGNVIGRDLIANGSGQLITGPDGTQVINTGGFGVVAAGGLNLVASRGAG